jgi:hypothetical protein
MNPNPFHYKRPRSYTLLFVIFLLIGFATYSYQQFDQLNKHIVNLEQSMGGVIDETGKRLKIVDQMALFGQDLNEIRRFLYLPVKNYSFTNDEREDTEDSTGSGSQLASLLFSYVDKTAEKVKEDQVLQTMREQLSTMVHDMSADPTFVSKSISSTAGKESDIGYTYDIMVQSQPFVSYLLRKTDHHILATDFRGIRDFTSLDQVKTDLLDVMNTIDQLIALKTRMEQTQKTTEAVMNGNDIKTILQQKKLKYTYPTISNADGSVTVSVAADSNTGDFKITIGKSNQTFSDRKAFQETLIQQLNALDTSTAIEQFVSQRQKELQALLIDPAFQAVLQEKGLKISTEPVIETDRIYFHLTDAANKRLSSIVIEKGTGEVFVVDGQGTNQQTLQDFVLQDSVGVKKKY